MKQKRYWLRGGLTILTIEFIIFISLFFSGLNTGGFLKLPYWVFVTNTPGYLIVNLISKLFHLSLGTLSSYALVSIDILLSIVIYFAIGCGLGWLYGKTRN